MGVLNGDARFENGEPPAVPRFQKVRSSKTSAVLCIPSDRPERNSPSWQPERNGHPK